MMADGKIIVPEAMRRAFGRGTQDADPEGYLAFHGLEQVILWLTDILHERNPEFHRAILKREKEYFPGDDGNLPVISRRVDFEYGVSFARNYIRDMFVAPEPVSFPCAYCGSTEMMGRNYEKDVCGPCYNLAVRF